MPLAQAFDPERVAHYETEGWRAYYDRKTGRAFVLLTQLMRSQFGMSWPEAVLAVFDVIRAYLAFQPKRGDLFKTRYFLERFYRRAKHSMRLAIDPRLAAQRELEYWIVHRVTVLDPNREPLIGSLAELHAEIFESTPAAMRKSAIHRANAATAVDRITNKTSTDVDGDWREVYTELCRAYAEIARHAHEGASR